jgi:hypothetical protein
MLRAIAKQITWWQAAEIIYLKMTRGKIRYQYWAVSVTAD